MKVTLYSTNCPRCKVLEAKLNLKNIQYQVESDMAKMEALGIMSVPVLQIDDELFQFKEANDWLNHYVGGDFN